MKKFRIEAENRGLICTKTEDMGWDQTDYSEEFEVFIGHIVPDDVFNIRRIHGDIPPPIIHFVMLDFGRNLGYKN